MSTSFCYGCLYAVRKEVQGVGLAWAHVWEESSPGDPMSLGLVLLMIAFDGCLYAVIGYLIARYSNSGIYPKQFVFTFGNKLLTFLVKVLSVTSRD